MAGDFYIWLDFAIYRGSGFEQGSHLHYAAQICVAMDGPLLLQSTLNSPGRRYEAVLVPSSVSHRTESGRQRLQIYLDPMSSLYRRIINSNGPPDEHGFVPIPSPPVAEIQSGADGRLRGTIENWLRTIACTEAEPVDPRITYLLEYLEARLCEDPADLRLEILAAEVGLSPGRLRTLFRETTGLSVKAFRLWLRLRRAILLASGGDSDLTTAAHTAGFADLAHFSRTFRRAFGAAPSTIWRTEKTHWHIVHRPGILEGSCD